MRGYSMSEYGKQLAEGVEEEQVRFPVRYSIDELETETQLIFRVFKHKEFIQVWVCYEECEDHLYHFWVQTIDVDIAVNSVLAIVANEEKNSYDYWEIEAEVPRANIHKLCEEDGHEVLLVRW